MSISNCDSHGTAYALAGPIDAPALVMIHGVGLDQAIWSSQVNALGKDLRVITYDMLGHGQSVDPPGPRKLEDFVKQLLDLLDYLELDRVGLAGFSMGGLVTQAFSLAHPGRVNRLALLNTVFQRTPTERQAVRARVAQVETQGSEAGLDAALERWLNPAFRVAHPEVEAYIRQCFSDNSTLGYLKAYRVFAEGDAEIGSRLIEIKTPTLVITGDADSGSTPAMSQAMAKMIPRSRVVILSGLRHLSLIEGADEVNRLLIDFFVHESKRASLVSTQWIKAKHRPM